MRIGVWNPLGSGRSAAFGHPAGLIALPDHAAAIAEERMPDGVVVVHARGEIDLACSDEFAAPFEDAIHRGVPAVVADLRDATFVDSLAVRTLLRAQRRLEHAGAGLAIAASPAARHVLELLGVTGRVPVRDGLEDALAAARDGRTGAFAR